MMNGKEFLQQLEKELKGVPKEEKVELLNYYTEYLAEAEDEIEAVAKLPTPEEIVSELLEESGINGGFIEKMIGIIQKHRKLNTQERLEQQSLKWHFFFIVLITFCYHTLANAIVCFGAPGILFDPETGAAYGSYLLLHLCLVIPTLFFQYYMVKSEKLALIQGKSLINLVILICVLFVFSPCVTMVGQFFYSFFYNFSFFEPMYVGDSNSFTKWEYFRYLQADLLFFFPICWYYWIGLLSVLVLPFHGIRSFIRKNSKELGMM